MQSVARNILARGSNMLIAPRRTYISGPPQNRISFVEKAATGIIMSILICATPMWIMTHLEDYKKRE